MVVRFVTELVQIAALAQVLDEVLIKSGIEDIGNHSQAMRAALLNGIDTFFYLGIAGLIREKAADQGKAGCTYGLLDAALRLNILVRKFVRIVRSKEQGRGIIFPELLPWQSYAHLVRGRNAR